MAARLNTNAWVRCCPIDAAHGLLPAPASLDRGLTSEPDWSSLCILSPPVDLLAPRPQTRRMSAGEPACLDAHRCPLLSMVSRERCSSRAAPVWHGHWLLPLAAAQFRARMHDQNSICFSKVKRRQSGLPVGCPRAGPIDFCGWREDSLFNVEHPAPSIRIDAPDGRDDDGHMSSNARDEPALPWLGGMQWVVRRR